MAKIKSKNCLRTFRRKTGLTQREVAFLLGSDDATQVSHHERGTRLPNLSTALAYHLILGPPIEVLFADVRSGLKLRAKNRLRRLRARLASKHETGRKAQVTLKKISWIGHQLIKCNERTETIRRAEIISGADPGL
jgi:DNA-binding XRE family transcriptional regulator